MDIPWLAQILNRIGKNSDAAAPNTTLFAGQQKIADDLAALPTTAQVNAEVDTALDTAIPGSPTAGSVNDVLKDLDARLPGSGTLSTLAAGDVPLAVPSADSTDNVYERDVIGNKTDAAVTSVGTTKSLMAYVKGILGCFVPSKTAATTSGVIVQDGSTGTVGLVTVTSHTDPDTLGSWTQLDASASADSWISHITTTVASAVGDYVVEIGTGGAGSESTKCRYSLYPSIPMMFQLQIPIKVASGTRIAARISKSVGGGAQTLKIGLSMYQSLE